MLVIRLYIAAVLLVVGCHQATLGQNKSASRTVKTDLTKEATEDKLDKQLKIYKSTLLEGKNEQIRIDAATVMLFSEHPLARKILLDTLKQTENSAARVAVCKALSQSRSGQQSVKNKQDFIRPLLDMLATDDPATAKLAAEATLIFEYEQISQPLEQMIGNPSLPVNTRLNAIYALELHPDMTVAIKLIGLLDNPEKQVAAAAEEALLSMGIKVGKDPDSRKKAVKQLLREGPEGFLRKWLIRQREQIRQMHIEMGLWQDLCLAVLNKMYESMTDDEAKGKLLAGYLQNPRAVVRLWALEKIRQDRVGTSKNPKLPVEVGPVLLNLISDEDRDVRLKTARLLPLMGEVKSARPLLAQLDIEPDDEVKMELFLALGYAFVSDPKIPSEVRKQTLEWTVKYLAEQDPKKVQKGAEVMKKLLEQNELTATEVDRYLGLLVKRYRNSGNDGALRGELLSAMAGLCAPQSLHSVQSRRLFKPLFDEALSHKTNLVREAAVEGLIYIDKAQALEKLRKDFTNDPSTIIRKRLIILAGEVGGKEDLIWLAEKIGSNAKSELAWQAMLKIFRRAAADVLNVWTDQLASQESKPRLSNEQKISFLEIAQQKAVGENKPIMLKKVREKLADIYSRIGQFERAADYLARLYETAQTTEEKETVLPELLDVYLRWPKVKLAAKLVENCLLQKDLDPNNALVRSIDNYFRKPPAETDPNVLFEALEKIETPPARPLWQKKLKEWAQHLGKDKEAVRPPKR